MTKVFIAGEAGTAGLRLRSRLVARPDVTLLEIDAARRKDADELRKQIALADFVFLCLPDEAAREVAALAAGMGTRVIDCSTAHRTSPDWAYGFPELSATHRDAIVAASRVAVPGCHASGLIALVYPLISREILSPDALLHCVSLTGYSGGGKKMIADYEAANRGKSLNSPMLYAMGQAHKHLPEISAQCGLVAAPTLLPIVGDFYAGMLTTVALHSAQLNSILGPDELRACYRAHYGGSPLIRVMEDAPSALHAAIFAGRDDMAIYVSGNGERILLSALFDNLGKGASGAAVECFNLMCGLSAETGLVLG